jgi:hypothetical protein
VWVRCGAVRTPRRRRSGRSPRGGGGRASRRPSAARYSDVPGRRSRVCRNHRGTRAAAGFTRRSEGRAGPVRGFPRVRSDPTATAGAGDTREVDVASPREVLSLHAIDQSSGTSGRSRTPEVIPHAERRVHEAVTGIPSNPVDGTRPTEPGQQNPNSRTVAAFRAPLAPPPRPGTSRIERRKCPLYERPLGVAATFCHDPHQPGRKTRDLWGGVAMRTRDHTALLSLLLTSRRHIDFGRTSSAICRLG